MQSFVNTVFCFCSVGADATWCFQTEGFVNTRGLFHSHFGGACWQFVFPSVVDFEKRSLPPSSSVAKIRANGLLCMYPITVGATLSFAFTKPFLSLRFQRNIKQPVLSESIRQIEFFKIKRTAPAFYWIKPGMKLNRWMTQIRPIRT